MKLWELRPLDGRREWSPWYDKAFGFVVRAETQEDARKIVASAYEQGMQKGPGNEGPEVWIDPDATSCVELVAEGDPKIIIVDFVRA
jgi:hypothetical protein